jgi:DNA/RNA-binding domain of Phe-tRNA-synthetase-like protein
MKRVERRGVVNATRKKKKQYNENNSNIYAHYTQKAMYVSDHDILKDKKKVFRAFAIEAPQTTSSQALRLRPG